jgi:hypothetical protein
VPEYCGGEAGIPPPAQVVTLTRRAANE